MTIRTMSRIVCFLLLIVATVTTQAADELLERAQGLIDQKQPQAAYELLLPLAEARAGDPAFDYLLGLSALDSGRALEAVFALERVVDAAPENGPARAELARAYLVLGDTDDAESQFEKVQEMELPDEVQRTIDRYMSNIDQYHDVSRTRWRPYIRTGFGYDSNVNSATDDNQIAIPALGGITINLSDPSRESDSAIWNVGGGIRLTSPLDYERGVSMFLNASLDNRLALSESEFSTTFGSGELGVSWRRDPKNQLRVSIDGSTVKIRGATSTLLRSDREVAGGSVQWQHTMDQANQFTLFGQGAIVRYPDQRVRDVNRYTGGAGWGHAFLGSAYNPVIFLSAFGGVEDETHGSRSRQFGRTFWGGRAGGQLTVGPNSTVFGSITYQASDYDGTDPTFLTTRDDDYVDVSVGYRYQLDSNWSVSPTFVYNNNDSNIVTNDYDRYEFMITVRNDF